MLKRQWDGLSEAIESWMRGSNGATRFYNGEKRRGTEGMAAARRSVMPRVLAGLMILTAVLMITFVAAATMVKSFSGGGKTRLTHVTAEQYAASEYRKARARCQLLAAAEREACIAEAHASEQRARAVTTVTQRDYMTTLRAQTDAAIDAGDRDRIIVEPACNIVARGQGSLCEIQIKPGMAGTNLIPAKMTAAQYAAANPIPMARTAVREARSVPVVPGASANPFQRSAESDVSANSSPSKVFQLAWSTRQ